MFLPSMYWSDEFLNRSAKSLDIQASPRASTFAKNIFATTRALHATTFEQHLLNHLRLQCSHSRSCIRSEHSCCRFQANAPTQSHLCLVILTNGRYAKDAEGPTRWSHGEGQHLDLRKLPWLRLQCSYSRSCIRSEHSCCRFQAIAPTQSHLRVVILTPGRNAKDAEGPTRWSHGEGQH